MGDIGEMKDIYIKNLFCFLFPSKCKRGHPSGCGALSWCMVYRFAD